ncbi:arsenic resistance protein [Brevibacterium casei]
MSRGQSLLRTIDRLTMHQTLACLGAVGLGALAGAFLPSAASVASSLVTPLLILLLFTTFIDIPLRTLAPATANLRFAAVVLMTNFLIVPLLVWALHTVVPLPASVAVPVLIVLLTPCIDYVIVFTGMAGGASGKLLALTPVLMIVQILLLPVWLGVIAGDSAPALITPGPFLTALTLFIVLPLAAALLVQLGSARSRIVHGVRGAASTAMLPLMLLTLFAVAASEVRSIVPHLPDLGSVAVVCVLFAAVMTLIGWGLGAWSLAEVGERRALIFTGVTRNSLVMLPLVRAVDGDGLGTAAVVTQTLVELLVMVVLVRIVPRLVPDTAMSENR